MTRILENGRGGRVLSGSAWTEGSRRRAGKEGRAVARLRPVSPELAVGCMALVAVAMVVLVTPHGIGLSPDSLAYVGAARNIAAGLGFSMPPANEPIAHLAPLYSHLLALLGLAAGGPLEAARWLAAALFGMNILLVFRLTREVVVEAGTGSAWLPVAASGLVLAAPPMWQIHLMAWTESLFICATLCGLWLLGSYLSGLRMRWLVLAAVAVAVSIESRYAGLSIWAGLAGSVLMFRRGSMWRKTVDAALFSVISLAPFALWSVRNLWIAGSATSRSVRFHPITADRAREGLSTVASWMMVSEQASGWIKLAALLIPCLLLVGAVVFWRAGRPATARPDAPPFVVPVLVKAAALAGVVYVGFLVASISLADDNTPLDQRILSPLFVLLLIPLVYGLCAWTAAFRHSHGLRLGTVCLVGVLGLFQLAMAFPTLRGSYDEGIGFSNIRWQEPGLIRTLKEIPADEVVYSNSPDAVYFLSGREARRLPTPFFATTRTVNQDYAKEVAEFGRQLAAGGLLVVLDLGASQATRQAGELVRDLQLVRRRTFAHGILYAR